MNGFGRAHSCQVTQNSDLWFGTLVDLSSENKKGQDCSFTGTGLVTLSYVYIDTCS